MKLDESGYSGRERLRVLEYDRGVV